jgi:aspartate aminotransferase-like enzyme
MKNNLLFDKKAIFTPGPVKMSKDIKAIGGLQTPYFRNKEFSDILLDCEKHLLQLAHAPQGGRVIFITASGTAAMEAAVINLLDQSQSTLIINGGGFGQRFVDICQLHQLPVNEVKVENNNLADTACLNAYQDATALCVNAHETSIGLLYNLNAIGQFCKKNKLLNIVDAISLFVTDPLDMVEQHIDVLILSSQKGLALPPGLSMVILSPQAIKQIKPKRSYYLDFNTHLTNGLRGQTPFTPAVSIILQLYARLEQISDSGIDSEQLKTKQIADYFRKAIEPLPLSPYTQYMPNAMTALTPTDGKKAFDIVNLLEEKYNIVVAPNGGDLQDVIFRVSHMGDMTQAYTDRLINALFDIYGVQR